MSPALEAHSVSKTFGSHRALDSVSVAFQGGEIHAVLGENGAGKSTLMKILGSELRPDAGEIRFRVPNSQVAIVHQHFMLVPAMTVAENFALASEHRRFSCDPSAESAASMRIAKDLDWALELQDRVESLPVGVQQKIEILKALSTRAEVLIFDEPTAVLSPSEVADLFQVLRNLRSDGKSIILIAHKLSEVLEIADRVTVLRHGRVVGHAERTEFEPDVVARWMVGDLPPPVSVLGADPGPVLVEANAVEVVGDRGETVVSQATFAIHRGEIVGIGGIDGNGQVELAEALCGIRPYKGEMSVPERIAYIPQDRHRDGLALRMSVAENLLVGRIDDPSLRQNGLISVRHWHSWAHGLVKTFDIRATSIHQPVGLLSGGNQQKVVIGRCLSNQPSFVVAVNPTRGLDLSATAEVHRQLIEFARKGAAIALFTTDLDELGLLAHRRLAMSRGRIVDADSSAAITGASK